MFMKEKPIVVEGEVVENLPNTLFRVKLFESERIILCYLSGKMRKNFIKILPGDRVKVEITQYDPNRGRIVYRK
ncbi:MAG: translation initiation factor IF-1 [Patescibacteria group bacterium]|nr:translation initiation factor IF-1 [Patescibacteria group bacterium]